jgi:hypothetical protein
LKREAIFNALRRHYRYYASASDADEPPLDPRWLDLAVQLKHLELVSWLIRPGHPAANAFLKTTFDQTLAKAKQVHDCHEVVAAMIHAQHPDATDAFIAALQKFAKKMTYFDWWFRQLVPELPKSALPRLEALVPTLNEKMADSMLGYMQELRATP